MIGCTSKNIYTNGYKSNHYSIYGKGNVNKCTRITL